MITKKQYKKIAKGDYVTLIDGIEDLIGKFNDGMFNVGYDFCLKEMDILSTKLADHILDTAISNKSEGEKDVFFLKYEELAETIKEFYKEQLNGK